MGGWECELMCVNGVCDGGWCCGGGGGYYYLYDASHESSKVNTD